MSAAPPVTVVMPARDAEATIAQAIASTLQQSYADFELWVLENGSSDRTTELARSFRDSRVKIFELGQVGFQGAVQYAIDHASSEWLARMDSDDLMFPDRLKVQMQVIRERPELVFVGTAFALLTPFGHIFEQVRPLISREVDIATLCSGRYFANPSVTFRRRVALEVGGVDPELMMDDIPLWFRLLSRGSGWEIAKPLHVYRLRANSLSKNIEFMREGRRARAKYAPQTVARWARMPDAPDSGWYSIGVLELLAGDGGAARQAAVFLEREAETAARRMRWLSHLGRIGYLVYRWRNDFGCRYRRRRDWERLFAPFLAPREAKP